MDSERALTVQIDYEHFFQRKYQLPYLFDCKPRLIMSFSSFRTAYNQGRLTFFSLAYRKVSITPSLSLATFC